MTKLLSLPEYEAALAGTRDARMAWWREARFGLFVHYGLYAALGRNEWAMAFESIPVGEYEQLTEQFQPKPGAAREWAQLARDAGMKYMVLTTRHHDGFSLWDSKVNPYNSVNLGPHRDIVREFVDACREFGLRIGFYSSLMDWHHPDGAACAYDSAARARFNEYIYEMNRELLTQYGKIDILWYDVAMPMEHAEGWNSLERNQRLRALQPDIIINNRSRLPEDFGTPEEHITADGAGRDWEACMTFNNMSWGYIDAGQAGNYNYNAHAILRMLNKVTQGGGNLLINIGPTPDGSVPDDVIAPLKTVGEWLRVNGECTYGKPERFECRSSGVSDNSVKGNTVYVWDWIWPTSGTMCLGGFTAKLKRAHILGGGEIEFEQEPYRIILKNMAPKSPGVAGVAVIALEFEAPLAYVRFPLRPALNKGKIYPTSTREAAALLCELKS